MSRETISLNGSWDIQYDPENTGQHAGWANNKTMLFDNTIEVPSTWNLYNPDYEGVAYYRRTFLPERKYENKTIRLRFGAVNYSAEVFLNGTTLGKHEGGYTPFEFDITDAVRFDEDNLLVVRVVDPPNDGSGKAIDGLKHMEIPSGKESWYVNFSGIWQDVELIISDKTYIDTAVVTPNIGDGSITVRLVVKSCDVCDGDITFSAATPDGSREIASDTRIICIEKGENLSLVQLQLDSFLCWEPDNPELYLLTVNLDCRNHTSDSLSVKFGMRQFELKDNFFYLNGKMIILRGLLHQQQYPKNLAYPESKDEIRRIIRLLKKGGWNLIRAHIRPTTPAFLDVCDEEGMLVFEEPAIGWIVESENLKERALTEVREMTRRDRNHPSIVMWGILNESGVRGAPDILGRTKMYWNQSDMGVQNIKHELARAIRKEDPSRIISDDSGAVTCNYYLPDSSEPVNYFDNHLYMSYPLSHAGFEVFRNLGHPEDFFHSHQFGSFHIDHRIGGGSPDKLFLQSEFGCGGLPLWPKVLKYYDDGSGVTYRDEAVYRRIDGILRDYYSKELEGVFDSYEEALAETQKVQAASVRRMVEALRANSLCSGYVFTQLHDNDYECNAGILDPLFQPKLAYQASREANRAFRIVLEIWERTVYTGGKFNVSVTVVNDAGISGECDLFIAVSSSGCEQMFSTLKRFTAEPGIQEVFSGEISAGDIEGMLTTKVVVIQGDSPLDSAAYTTHVLAGFSDSTLFKRTHLIDFDGAVRSWFDKHSLSVTSDNPELYVIEPSDKSQLADNRIIEALEHVKNNGGDVLFLGLPLICLSDADEELQELRDQGKYVCWCSPTEFESDTFDFPIPYYDSKPRFVGPYHYFKKHPVFEGLDPGHILDDRYANIMPLTSVRIDGAETIGGSFGTPIGYHFKIRGCEHALDPRYGSDLAVVPYGKGRLIISTYRIADNLGVDPVADKLLSNMLRGF